MILLYLLLLLLVLLLLLLLLLLSLLLILLFVFQILMSVLITMGDVPISVTILKVVIIVSVLPGMTFKLTITIVQVNILLYVSLVMYNNIIVSITIKFYHSHDV